MAQLVSDFIITPVLRQARRFSSGFAASEPPTIQHRRTWSAGGSRPAGSAILEGEEHGRLPVVDAVLDSSDTDATPTTQPPHLPRGAPVPAAPADSPHPGPDNPQTTPEDARNAGPPSTRPIEPNAQHQTPPATAATGATSQPTWPQPETTMNTPLPEDDGMGDLRRRIQAIQLMDVPQNTKAQLMHQLLTEKYTKLHQPPKPAQASARPVSPASTSTSTLATLEAPEHIFPLQVLKKWNPLGDGSTPLNLPLTEEDLKPTYAPTRRPAAGEWWTAGEEEVEEDAERRLGCEHYTRNVKLQCASCERWYTCRLCHDAVEDHVLPRQQTKHMLCMLCGCAQKASDTCSKCGVSAAYYYCGICKLWNNDPNKPIYHCADCGLCRVGQGLGKDFFHCKKCMTCVEVSANHKCFERSVDCDCPICNEYLFNSPRSVIFMQCGHSIHRHCFDEHMKTSYKCPLCNKSCINMEYQFRNIDVAILTQPMPPEYADARAVISCNDCSAKSQTAYHWLGLKCAVCRSYNTTQLQLLNMPGGRGGGESVPDAEEDQRQQESRLQLQQQLQQQLAGSVSLGGSFHEEEVRRQQQRKQNQTSEPDQETTAGSFALLSTSPSSYSPANLLRLLHRTAVNTLSSERLASSSSPPPGDREEDSGEDGAYPSATSQRNCPEDEDDDSDDDMLDLFGARDRDFDRMTGLTSAESAVGFDDDEYEEESSEEEEEDGDGEEEEEDEEEDEIVLLGHR
ncbi:hypothetical protein VTI74DRAFT_11288 [Chaetomium olivicolor]